MEDKKKCNPLFINIMLATVTFVVCFSIGEFVLRQFYSNKLFVYQEERALLYRFDEQLGWFPRSNSTAIFNGSRPVSVSHNSRGFRDVEYTKNNKPGILFIGDSFVWGYDVEQPERFTEKLRTKLAGWNVNNLGVSGYGTDQEYLLLRQQFDFYVPRIVFLVFCTDNDDNDNLSNAISNGAYYKPYFKVRNHTLELQGVPVPKSLTYFARQHPVVAQSYVVRLMVKAISPKVVRDENEFPPSAAILNEMNEFVSAKGSKLVVGLVERQPYLENFMNSQNIPYVQLTGAERYNTNWYHWTPQGHTVVGNKIYEFLSKSGLLKSE